MREGLRGKVVLITGPARGIGAETARRGAARGARLSLVGLEPERLAALAAELGGDDGGGGSGGEHVWHECDVTDQIALERAVAGTINTFGRIDVVVANAGIACQGTAAITPADALVRVIEVNLIGVVRTVCATLPAVTSARGYYLLVSSAAALAPLPGISTYAASKSGVEQFGNALRLELAHKGVGVGVAHPAWIDTDLVRDPQSDLESFREVLRTLPGPFGSVTTVGACAAAFVQAIERRSRKVYVPRSLAPLAGIRQLFTSALAERIMGRHTRRLIPQSEREVLALGRFFGVHSVAAAAAGPDDQNRPAAEPDKNMSDDSGGK